MAFLKRLPTELILYKVKESPAEDMYWAEEREVVCRVVSTKITRVMSSARASAEKYGHFDYGTCRIYYNRDPIFWNEFRFTDLDQMYEIWLEDTRPSLLRDFAKDGTLDRRYLSKREQSAKQRAATMRNIKKLPKYTKKVV